MSEQGGGLRMFSAPQRPRNWLLLEAALSPDLDTDWCSPDSGVENETHAPSGAPCKLAKGKSLGEFGACLLARPPGGRVRLASCAVRRSCLFAHCLSFSRSLSHFGFISCYVWVQHEGLIVISSPPETWRFSTLSSALCYTEERRLKRGLYSCLWGTCMSDNFLTS